jgi:hypothetical protein
MRGHTKCFALLHRISAWGTNNLLAIEPPSILADNLSQFAFYDRIYVDGRSR